MDLANCEIPTIDVAGSLPVEKAGPPALLTPTSIDGTPIDVSRYGSINYTLNNGQIIVHLVGPSGASLDVGFTLQFICTGGGETALAIRTGNAKDPHFWKDKRGDEPWNESSDIGFNYTGQYIDLDQYNSAFPDIHSAYGIGRERTLLYRCTDAECARDVLFFNTLGRIYVIEDCSRACSWAPQRCAHMQKLAELHPLDVMYFPLYY